MPPPTEYTYTAILKRIGINPFVSIPEALLKKIFEMAGKTRSPIRVRGTINTKPYEQSMVKFKGEWRLYINNQMLPGSPLRVGEAVEVTISFNNRAPSPVQTPPALQQALHKDKEAMAVYKQLPPYLKKEIDRYLSNLKTTESLNRNVSRAINFLKGKERFMGRDKP